MHNSYRSIPLAPVSLLLCLSMLASAVVIVSGAPITGHPGGSGFGSPSSAGLPATDSANAGACISGGGPPSPPDPVQVLASISLGEDPGLAAYDSQNGYVYLTNAGSHNVSLIDATELRATVSVGESPEFPTYDSANGWIYFSNVGYHTVEAVNGTILEPLITVGANPRASAFDPGNGYVYVPNQGSNSVSVVSGTTVVATVRVGTGPSFATYDSANGYMYVGNGGGSNVSVLSGTVLVGTVSVGSEPLYATFDSANGYVYISNAFSNNVSVINGRTVVGVVSVDGSPGQAAYNSNDRYVYVPILDQNYGVNAVSVISGTAVVGTVGAGFLSEYAVYDARDGYVYVTNSGSDSVSVINGTTVVATVSVGSTPSFETFDPGNGYVYVTNGGSSNVSVIGDTASYAVTFTESGAPRTPYLFWGVTLDGFSEDCNTTALSPISFEVPNGTYNYTVTSTGGYTSNPSSGSMTVSGANVWEVVTFTSTTLTSYSVTFEEVGLQSGTTWSLSLNGTAQTGSGGTLTVAGFANGSYPFSVRPVPGYTANPFSGSIAVNGENATQVITFTPVTYRVAFTETGLGSGISWSVTLNGTTITSDSASIAFTERNGSYSFVIGSVAGYNVTPPAGNVEVVFGGPVNVGVTFTSTANLGGAAAGIASWIWVTAGILVVVIVVGTMVVVMRRKPPASPAAAPPAT